MANNYTQSSSVLVIPKGKQPHAELIADRVILEISESEAADHGGDAGDYPCGVDLKFTGREVWMCGGEAFNPEHAERIARALVEELEIDEPFYCSWAYTCSRLRINEFGGGAFAVVRGKETVWCDAMQHVMTAARNLSPKETATQGSNDETESN